MTITAAFMQKQGINFVVIPVKYRAMDTPEKAKRTIEGFRSAIANFSELPLILATQNSHGDSVYWGEPRVVRMLRNMAVSEFSWKEYKLERR